MSIIKIIVLNCKCSNGLLVGISDMSSIDLIFSGVTIVEKFESHCEKCLNVFFNFKFCKINCSLSSSEESDYVQRKYVEDFEKRYATE